MTTIGMLSAYSGYAASASSIYASMQASYITNGQQTFDAENPVEDLSITGDINDEALISEKAKTMSALEKSEAKSALTDGSGKELAKGTKTTDDSSTASTQSGQELTADQQKQIEELKVRDTEVKAHEQAHLAAATGIGASSPSYTYKTGPDGKRYAVGGEVSISFKESKDPQVNLANAQTMEAAALAPVDPSSQDKMVAKNAEKLIAEAREQIAEQKSESNSSASEDTSAATTSSTSTAISVDKSTPVVKSSSATEKSATVNESKTKTAAQSSEKIENPKEAKSSNNTELSSVKVEKLASENSEGGVSFVQA